MWGFLDPRESRTNSRFFCVCSTNELRPNQSTFPLPLPQRQTSLSVGWAFYFLPVAVRVNMKLSNLNSWKDITLKVKAGFLVSLIALVFAGWLGSDIYIVTHAEAAEAHQKIARWHLADVRLQIENKEALKVETKYRADLGQRAKDELIAAYDVKLKRLRNTEKCLTQGRVDCE